MRIKKERFNIVPFLFGDNSMSTEKTWCVYMHRSPSNKAYIGITSKQPEQRWDNGNGYKKQQYFWRAINKYKWENFEYIVFADNLDKNEACHMEQLLIAFFDTTNRDKGYNVQLGGEVGNLGISMSEETKRKLSDMRKGKHPSAATRIKLSQAQKQRWTEGERKKEVNNILVAEILCMEFVDLAKTHQHMAKSIPTSLKQK